MGLDDLLNLFVAAILLADIYTTMSIGMTVIYGVMKMVNLAHTGFMKVGYAVWGADERSIFTPLIMATFRFGGIVVPVIRLIVFGIALLSLVALHLSLQHTWFGRSVRALTQNREAGQLAGVTPAARAEFEVPQQA